MENVFLMDMNVYVSSTFNGVCWSFFFNEGVHFRMATYDTFCLFEIDLPKKERAFLQFCQKEDIENRKFLSDIQRVLDSSRAPFNRQPSDVWILL